VQLFKLQSVLLESINENNLGGLLVAWLPFDAKNQKAMKKQSEFQVFVSVTIAADGLFCFPFPVQAKR